MCYNRVERGDNLHPENVRGKMEVPYNVVFGFDLYSEIASDASDYVLAKLKEVLPSRSWCVIGGGAMMMHFGRDVRIISPDLDIMLLPQALSMVSGLFGRMFPGTFGHSVVYEGLTIDFLAATRGWQRALVKRAIEISGLPVVAEVGLIALKFNSQRDKDLADLLAIYKIRPQLFNEARPLIKSVFSNDVEDYDSVVMLLKHQASI
jgi:hypothetical protein